MSYKRFFLFWNDRYDHKIYFVSSESILVILVNSASFIENRHNFPFLRDLESLIIRDNVIYPHKQQRGNITNNAFQ